MRVKVENIIFSTDHIIDSHFEPQDKSAQKQAKIKLNMVNGSSLVFIGKKADQIWNGLLASVEIDIKE